MKTKMKPPRNENGDVIKLGAKGNGERKENECMNGKSKKPVMNNANETKNKGMQ